MTEKEQRPRENNIWTKATTVFLEDFFGFCNNLFNFIFNFSPKFSINILIYSTRHYKKPTSRVVPCFSSIFSSINVNHHWFGVTGSHDTSAVGVGCASQG